MKWIAVDSQENPGIILIVRVEDGAPLPEFYTDEATAVARVRKLNGVCRCGCGREVNIGDIYAGEFCK